MEDSYYAAPVVGIKVTLICHTGETTRSSQDIKMVESQDGAADT